MFALDTETTGTDLRHGAKPYLVTTCELGEDPIVYEWDVDPYTREPEIPKEDIEQIRNMLEVTASWGHEDNDEEIRERHVLVAQNSKFDCTALASIGIKNWPWKQTRDTLVAGHLLGSGYPHDLTSMVIQYLSEDIEPYETRLKDACNTARRLARSKFPDWAIAKEGRIDMPSAGAEPWKYDTWLPRALWLELGDYAICQYLETRDHKWDTLSQEYAAVDSFFTVQLWNVMRQLIRQQDQWDMFLMQMQLPPILYRMEERGVTLSARRLEQQRQEYERESCVAEETCVSIAAEYGYNLKMPKSGNNKQLHDFVFNVMGLPTDTEVQSQKRRKSTTGNPSLDKEVLADYVLLLPEGSRERRFVDALVAKRKRDTALSYMTSYESYWKEIERGDGCDSQYAGYRLLHPSVNQTGTAHLRMSSSNPNEQNISKQEGFNLRYAFGPEPGYEWWSLDAQNIELRIPTFEAEEKELMEVFLRPKEGPYYGSYHLVIFDLLHPELFKKHGKECKDLFESTWYQWVKNGNFAIVYGAQEEKADATYHVKGAYKKVRHRFPRIAALADRQIAIANKTGCVWTIPDKTINPRVGYPIMCARNQSTFVKPTLPLNYHVSGTASHWQRKGMIRCDAQLVEWRKREKFDAHLIMQVHDEMVFSMPKRSPSKIIPEGIVLAGKPGAKLPEKRVTTLQPFEVNLPRIRVLQKLMEQGGDDIGIPTPVGIEYNPETWDKGIRVV